MYDLHIHTNCSDGQDSPRTILQKAERLGLTIISITDHENCDAYNSLDAERISGDSVFSGKIIPGIETDTYIDGLSLELLGYCFNVSKMNEALRDMENQYGNTNLVMLQKLYERSVEAGVEFPPNVVEGYDKAKNYYSTEYLHDKMRENHKNRVLVPDEESWDHENIFFRRYTSNPDSPFYVDKSEFTPPAGVIIDMIHRVGGKVFIPHIFQYERHSETLLHTLLDKYNIDGIECFYPSFTQSQTEYLLTLCEKRNLFVSGGSDYHGAKRPGSMGVKNDDVGEKRLSGWLDDRE